MKKLLTLIAASSGVIGSVHAGAPIADSKKVIAPVEVFYGTGWYGAIDGGVNAYQDLGGSDNFSVRGGDRVTTDSDGTRTIRTRKNSVELDPNGGGVGGWGGLKLGYVFGTGLVRPAFEAEGFYNGIDSGVDVKVNGSKVASAGGRIDSGAFLGNALIRFNFQQFQPYFGFGLGGWVAQGNDITVRVGDSNKRSNFSTSSKDGLAWQIIAGADYYFTPKVSMFLEYKFLNYADAVIDNPIQQQLFGLGVRFHF